MSQDGEDDESKSGGGDKAPAKEGAKDLATALAEAKAAESKAEKPAEVTAATEAAEPAEAKAADALPKATATKVPEVAKAAVKDPPPKQEPVARPYVSAKPLTSAAEYVKGYEKRAGKLEIKGDAITFAVEKPDLAGKVALVGILALALDQYEVLVSVPLGDLTEVVAPSDKRKLELKTASETLTFLVEDRDAWLNALAGKDPHEADPNAPMSYPDDGPLARGVRSFDNMLGLVEKGLLVTLLAVVCLTAAAYTLLDHAFHYQIAWKAEVVHNGTFAIAMLGGVFATQQARHLSMDLISRRLSARNRLFLKLVLALFVAFIVVLMIRAGLHVIVTEKTMAHHDLISSVAVAWLIPIAGTLILLHTLLHTIIDIDYLRRGKTPPERMRSGH